MTPARILLAVLAAALLPAQTHQTTKVLASTLERKSRLPGEFLPYLQVDVYARVTGFVERVEVDRGSLVNQGQLLVRLSAPEMAAQIAEARARFQAVESQRAEALARLAAAESTHERLKEAARTPGAVAGNEIVLSEKAADSARALVKALESSARAAQAALQAQEELEGYLNVTAPFEGVATERLVHPGALVGPGAGAANSPLLRLEQTSRLRLVVPVPEADVAGIVKGARVSFTTPAHPGRAFHGTVARLAHSMDPKTRTMPVEMEVANPSGDLAPGMYPEVESPVRMKRPALLVPASSIVTTTERSFVIRVSNGRAEWVDVKRGRSVGDFVEVLGSLKPGDRVLTRGTDEIREGTPVAP